MTELFGKCISYNIAGEDSAMFITKQVKQAIDFDLKEDRMRCYKTNHSKILKQNDQKRPIIVHLDKPEWATLQDEGREAECGGNLPVGWVLWRIYSVNIPCYYKPVRIKKLNSEETKCYEVKDEWLFAFCPQYRTLL